MMGKTTNNTSVDFSICCKPHTQNENVCEEHACRQQLEQWYSTSSVTQSTVRSQERYNHNTSADSELRMYVAHYLGECRIGTYTMTIFTCVRSYYKRESPRKRCMQSEPSITA